MKRTYYLLMLLCLCFFMFSARATVYTISSPDGKIAVSVNHAEETGSLSYSVKKGGSEIISSSSLGLSFGATDFRSGSEYVSSETVEIDETYELPTGKQKIYRNHCNEFTLTISKNTRNLSVIFRVYDDGIAYRYTIAGNAGTISKELSEVVVVNSDYSWAQNYTQDHSALYPERDWAAMAMQGDFCAPVLVGKKESGFDKWCLITEAATYGYYAGAIIKSGSNAEVGRFYFSPIGSCTSTTQTPWRTVIVGTLNTIAESNMIENLNPATEMTDISWIKSGISSWDWGGQDGQQHYDIVTTKKYIDLAHDMGWPYFTLDEGWETSSANYSLQEVVDYAESKGVKLILWTHSNKFENNETQIRTRLKGWHDLGVAGIKVDFWDENNQTTMSKYDKLVKVAGEQELLVNLHGCTKPTGTRRYWPHLVTSEAAYCGEMYFFGPYTPANHNATLFFTRQVIGSFDYTPIEFATVNGRIRSLTTWSHQVALGVVYESGILTMADCAENYSNSVAKPLLKILPTSWDEMRCLEAEIDKIVTVVRRDGDDWYLASISQEARTMNIRLDFLGEGDYYAQIFKDGICRNDITYERQVVTKNSTLSIPISSQGGLTVRFSKELIEEPDFTIYEAENGARLGCAVNNDNAGLCSGGRFVGNLGNSSTTNKVTITVNVKEAGFYNLCVYYMTGAQRDMYMKVNNGTKDIYSYTGVASWDGSGLAFKNILIELPAGESKLEFGNDTDWAPNLDKISINPAEATDGELATAGMRQVYPYRVFANSQWNDESPLRAFDNNFENRWSSSAAGTNWLRMELVKPMKLTKIVVHHSGRANANWIASDYKIQANVNGNFVDLITVTGNTDNIATHYYEGDIVSDQIRLYVTRAQQNGNSESARIAEIQLYVESDEEGEPVEADKIYSIYPYNKTGRVVSVENSSLNNNAKIAAYTNAEVNSQRWKVTQKEGYYYLQNAYSGKYMAVSGTNVIQVQSASNSARWRFEAIEDEENCYSLVGDNGYVLQFPSGEEGSVLTAAPKIMANGYGWKFISAPEESNEFTVEMRKEIVDAWIGKYYMKATTAQNWTNTGYVIERPGFWDTAENMEIFLDAYETSHDPKYAEMYNQIYDNFKATQGNGDYHWNEYNDDLAWFIIGMIRAYLLFGDIDDSGKNRDYRAEAKKWIDIVYDRATIKSGASAGLIYWKQGLTTTNSCVNGPMNVAACYVAQAYKGTDLEREYYEKAKKIYELQRTNLTNLPTNGQIYDAWDPTNNTKNTWASTYNQGTFLGSAVMLWEYYGDTYDGKATTYKADAKKVIDYCISNLCNNGIISVCTQGGDLVGFKGILMRYVRKYIEVMPEESGDKKETYIDWMKKNVVHAYNNRNSNLVSWTAWLEKSNEIGYRVYSETNNGNTQIINQYYGAFGTGTVVSAAINIPYGYDNVGIDELNKVKQASAVRVGVVGNRISISSKDNDSIQRVDIYDLQGKLILSEMVHSNRVEMSLPRTHTVVIVKVQTSRTVEAIKLTI